MLINFSQHIIRTDEYFTMMCAQDSYRIVPCFMQVVTKTTRKFATLGPLYLGPTFVCESNTNTGHISGVKYKHLSLKPVYLLYSRSINTHLIPKFGLLTCQILYASFLWTKMYKHHQPLWMCTTNSTATDLWRDAIRLALMRFWLVLVSMAIYYC